METKYLQCECGSYRHLMCFDVNPKDNEIIIGVQMVQYRNFFRRLYAAIRYLFGDEGRHGHWDCTLVSIDTFRKFTDGLLSEAAKEVEAVKENTP